MAQYKGKISKVYPSRFGGGSFGLDGQHGLYFNTKQPLPAFAVQGATVEFEGTLGRNNKSVFVNDASLKEVSGPAPMPAGGPSGGNGNEREARIQYQSAVERAVGMVSNLLAAGAVSLEKVAAAKRAGIIEDLTDRYTASFFEDFETFGALDRATPPEKAEPAKSEPETSGLPE